MKKSDRIEQDGVQQQAQDGVPAQVQGGGGKMDLSFSGAGFMGKCADALSLSRLALAVGGSREPAPLTKSSVSRLRINQVNYRKPTVASKKKQ